MTPKKDPPKFELSFERAVKALKKHGLYLQSQNAALPDASGIVADTRKLTPGDIFVAYAGVSQNLHRYIPVAVKNGCRFIVCEEKYIGSSDHTFIRVTNGRAAWAVLAAEGWRIHELKLRYIGITGTNGKTSVCHIVADMLAAIGIKSLSVGTLGYRVGRNLIPSPHTTPDPDEFYQTIAMARENEDIKAVVMEVSSHALAQHKLEPLLFDVCVFTSFSRDHLDFHATMGDYLNTKLRLFKEYAQKNARFVVHQDLIKHVEHIPCHDRWSFGVTNKPSFEQHLQIDSLGSSAKGAKVKITGIGEPQILDIPYINETGALNFAGALIAADFMAPESLRKRSWEPADLTDIPGRLERVSSGQKQDIDVVVDYCHTPDALEKCLLGVKANMDQNSKLWVVMGCGGDRDKGKRPVMGKIAVDCADEVVITSDNPRFEDPQKIIDDICSNLNTSLKNLHIEPDRQLAIEFAITHAGAGDKVIIAGKGHETYQIIGAQRLEFDDRAVATLALKNRANVCS